MKSKHDETAELIARKERVEYNRGQGPDVNSIRRAIEVETTKTARDALRQLQGFRKPVYIAGATAEATQAAMKVAQGTTVGVMDPHGKAVKCSTRRQSR